MSETLKKERMVKGMTEKEYNTNYMYIYKQVRPVTTERLLKNKASYIKKIVYIDEELKRREADEVTIEEQKRLKSINTDIEKMKGMYEKLKSVFESE